MSFLLNFGDFLRRLTPSLSPDRRVKAQEFLEKVEATYAARENVIGGFFTRPDYGMSPTQRKQFDETLSGAPDPEAAAKELIIDELLRHDSGERPDAIAGSRERMMQDFAQRKLGGKGPVSRDQFFDLAKKRFEERGVLNEDLGASFQKLNLGLEAYGKQVEAINAPAKELAMKIQGRTGEAPIRQLLDGTQVISPNLPTEDRERLGAALAEAKEKGKHLEQSGIALNAEQERLTGRVGDFEQKRQEARAKIARDLEELGKIPGLAGLAGDIQTLDANFRTLQEHNKNAPLEVQKAAANNYVKERDLLFGKVRDVQMVNEGNKRDLRRLDAGQNPVAYYQVEPGQATVRFAREQGWDAKALDAKIEETKSRIEYEKASEPFTVPHVRHQKRRRIISEERKELEQQLAEYEAAKPFVDQR